MRLRRGRARAHIRVVVDNRRCHQYGVCEAEATRVFQLTEDGRLHYQQSPSERDYERVLMAARHCPMQAITVQVRLK